MKYFRKEIKSSKKYFSYIFLVLSVISFLIFKNQIYRQIMVVNLPVLYLKFLNNFTDFKFFTSNKKPDKVNITMSTNNFVKLQKERSSMISNYILNGTQWLKENESFNIKYALNSTTSKGEIKLFGLNPDHYRDFSGHSFRIKFKGGIGFGNKKVNYLNPRTRDYITDVYANELYNFLTDGIKISYKPVKVIFNKVDYGYYLQEDFFDKYLIENNNRRESVIFEAINDSLDFNYIGLEDEFITLANNLNDQYINDFDSFLELFDVEKLKALFLIIIILNDTHPLLNTNLHWYFNPASGLIEPILREFKVNKHSKNQIDIKSYLLNNSILIALYDKKIKNHIENYFSENLNSAIKVLNEDEDIKLFENKILGFSSQINKRKNDIKYNIEFLKNNFQFQNSPTIDFYKKEEIVINKDTILKSDLVINENQKLLINSGVNLQLNGVNLRVLGGLEILGKKNQRVRVYGSQSSPGTIYVNSKSDVKIEFADFEYLSNENSSYDQPASITFYESDNIYISNSTFKNNLRGDDYINFFRCDNVLVTNSVFENILNDAIDSDFSSFKSDIVSFKNIGNDAIDGSGSNVIISNSTFENVMDKAISAGEKSYFEVKNSTFINNEIALVAKDESHLICLNNYLEKNRLDIVSFKKKKIFNYPIVFISNTMVSNYLVEENTIINGLDDVIFSKDIESKLYGNIYGKASE